MRKDLYWMNTWSGAFMAAWYQWPGVVKPNWLFPSEQDAIDEFGLYCAGGEL